LLWPLSRRSPHAPVPAAVSEHPRPDPDGVDLFIGLNRSGLEENTALADINRGAPRAWWPARDADGRWS
jgi:hypothetical protein